MSTLQSPIDLFWLPQHPDFSSALKSLKTDKFNSYVDWFTQAQAIAGHRLSFLEELKLGRAIQNKVEEKRGAISEYGRTVRIACIAETTVQHLIPSLRVAGLRRGLIFECYVAPFDQIRQEVFDPNSGLRHFKPEIVLIALASESATISLEPSLSASDVDEVIISKINDLKGIWSIVEREMGATVIQQTLSPIAPSAYGHFDAAVPSSPRSYISAFNAALKKAVFSTSAALLDLDYLYTSCGASNIFNPMLWHHAKQELSPQAAPLWADHVGRVIQALLGLSKKCLVLDLDNTLWGGVVGDDGIAGITLGMGSPAGEAFVTFQRYVKVLRQRGVLLAVCSKNTHEVAIDAINNHPEMVIKSSDFSAFMANWDGKPGNIETIADELRIGIGSLVFFDDNPAERDYVRASLPLVCVPEVPDDPAQYINCLEGAGYFDAVSLTEDDLQRANQYEANAQRKSAEHSAGNLTQYLAGLDMELSLSQFQPLDMQRITQLVNKTNQFNLTTRRYQQVQLEQLAANKNALTLSARLKDRFGDNGLISVVIANRFAYKGNPGLLIDTWLMSCRVLGRMVEHEIFNVLVRYAQENSIEVIVGEFAPTEKNNLVEKLYVELGFAPADELSGETAYFYTFAVNRDIPTIPTPLHTHLLDMEF